MGSSLSEDPETIREDSRFENLAHEESTISAVVRERMKQFRSKSQSYPYFFHIY
jgi:cell division control protein 6